MKIFINRELELLSDGLIRMIEDAGESKKLVRDRVVQTTIDLYIQEVTLLNTKICNMMK